MAQEIPCERVGYSGRLGLGIPSQAFDEQEKARLRHRITGVMAQHDPADLGGPHSPVEQE